MIDLRLYTVRPSVGTHRVEVTCRRCKGLVRDERLAGVATVADIVAAAEGHEKRLHRPQLHIVVHEGRPA